jgi:hypothetical protein
MAQLMLVNPRKRRKTAKKARRKTGIVSRASGLARRVSSKVRRYRRNPIGGSVSSPTTQLKNAAIGAAGALAVDVVMSKLPLPANLSTGMGRTAAQGLVSIGLGMAVAKFGKNKRLGVQLAEGGLTIALHGVMKGALAKQMPALAGYDDGLLGNDGLLGYDDGLLGYDDMLSEFNNSGYVGVAPTSY